MKKPRNKRGFFVLIYGSEFYPIAENFPMYLNTHAFLLYRAVFTGIIKDVGTVKAIERKNDGVYFTIECDMSKLADGEYIAGGLSDGASVSIDGVCQTVIKSDKKTFTVQSIPETLRVTTFESFEIGSKVNLEPAMRLNDSVDGHFVQGHVDCTGTVLGIYASEGEKKLRIKFPEAVENFVVFKGSISVSGVSLTISKVGKADYDDFFEVSLIRHTLENTNLGFLKKGDKVNLEVDMMARYAAKMVKNTL